MTDSRNTGNGNRPPPRPVEPAPRMPPPHQGATGPLRNDPLYRPPEPRRRFPSIWLTLAGLLIIYWLLVPLLFPETSSRITVPYTFFKEQVAAGNVVAITSRADDIQGTFRSAVVAPPDPIATLTPTTAAQEGTAQPAEGAAQTFTQFATIKPAFEDNALLPLLEAQNVVITANPLEESRSLFWTILLYFGPTLLLIGGFIWLNRRMARQAGSGGGIFSIGRSPARRYDEATAENRVTFEDVAGIDEVEDQLKEIVDFLKNPQKYQRLGGRIPKGVLLIGPPGTGKTLLARATAGEAGVPFFSMSGSEFIEMVVGVGASRVRDLFNKAREASPALIFVDELDAIGRSRNSGNTIGGNDEREQTLNQLLTEMDGFDSSKKAVIVLAATNRADVLDPALLRPGRFDRRVTVQPPDRTGRAEVLRVHTRNVPLASDVNLDAVAAQTPGFVGADLANLVNEAALEAAREGHAAVEFRDFVNSLEKIALGAERRIALNREDLERVAYHESGHALCGLLQPDSDPVRRVTIIPRGQALGVTLSVPDDDRFNYNESYLLARVVTALGGRAAEQVVYGTITTGAENDIRQVTDLARAMVTRFGMSTEVGMIAYSGTNEGNFLESGFGGGMSRPYSEATAQQIDRAVRRIVDESYQQALNLLKTNRARLDALTQALLKDESLDEREILRVTGLDKHANEKVGSAATNEAADGAARL